MKFMRDEEGATAVEYGVMVAAIAAAVIISAQLLGTNVNVKFNKVATDIGLMP